MANSNGGQRPSLTRTIVGVALIGLGAVWLIGQFFDLRLGHNLWPFLVIVPGVLLLGLSVSTEAGGDRLTIAGSIVTVTGLVLLYQNSFDHFESWAYAWALVAPGSIGLGQYVYGYLNDDERKLASGKRLMSIAAILFLVGLVFFELVINISGRGIRGLGIGSWVWPLLIVVAGLYVLFRPNLFTTRPPGGAADEAEEDEEEEAEPADMPEPPEPPEPPTPPAKPRRTARRSGGRAASTRRSTTTRRSSTRKR
jgi:hypothetical protein